MIITLKHNTPLSIADDAIGKCWDKCSVSGEVNIKRMHRVGNKFKHASTLEHISYNFDIDGISRALLQELARHRMANLSVKSSRYTLGELKTAEVRDYEGFLNMEVVKQYCVLTGDDDIDEAIGEALHNLHVMVASGKSNDKLKYCMPEAYKTSLSWTINMRSLQNFIALRSNKSALWEIRDLALAIYDQLPEDHQFMFVESLDKEYHGLWEESLIDTIGGW